MRGKDKSRTKRCCTTEYDRLVEELAVCDRDSKNASDRHRCYRLASRKGGSRAKKCINGV